jgi:TonB family protein
MAPAFAAPAEAVSIDHSRNRSYLTASIIAAHDLPPPQSVDANALQVARKYPEIGRIAAQTAKKVAKSDFHRILTTKLTGCLAAPQICAELDAVLHVDLENLIPGAQFIPREEAMKYLSVHGFISLDAYSGALDDVAGDAGAEVVIGEDLGRSHGKCNLRTTVVDAKHLYALAEFSIRISCSAEPTKTKLSLLKDPETGVSMIVSVPQLPDSPRDAMPIRDPSCISCPDPHYSEYARSKRVEGAVRLMITVTEQGTVEAPIAIGAVEEGLQRVSLEAVRGWKLTPARDSEGKLFPCRVLVEVMFRLIPR